VLGGTKADDSQETVKTVSLRLGGRVGVGNSATKSGATADAKRDAECSKSSLSIPKSSVLVSNKAEERSEKRNEKGVEDGERGKGLNDGNDEKTGDNSGGDTGSTAEAGRLVQIDESRPTVVVLLSLYPRRRVKQKFNTSHTLRDVARHVRALTEQGGGGGGAYELVYGFPPKVLVESETTVAEAKLKGGVVTQRLRRK
jgi:hypothetical protein